MYLLIVMKVNLSPCSNKIYDASYASGDTKTNAVAILDDTSESSVE